MRHSEPVNQTGPILRHVARPLSHQALVSISEGFIPSLQPPAYVLMSPTLLTEGQVSRSNGFGINLKLKSQRQY